MNKKARNILSFSLIIIALLCFVFISSVSFSGGEGVETSTLRYAYTETTDIVVDNSTGVDSFQVTLYSGSINILDVNGTYLPMTDVVSATYENDFFIITWNQKSVFLSPYAKVSGVDYDFKDIGASFPEIQKAIPITDNGKSYKFDINLTNASSVTNIGFRIFNYSNLSSFKTDASALIFDDLIRVDFLTNNFTLENSSDRIIIGNITANLDNQSRIWIDPTVTLSGSGQQLRDVSVDNSSADSRYSDIQIGTIEGTRKRALIMFNLSSIPTSSILSSSNLSLYGSPGDDGEDNIDIHEVYFWRNTTAGSSGEFLNDAIITWNNQPCGTGFDNSTYCNLTKENTQTTSSVVSWVNWTVDIMVQKRITDNSGNVSMILKFPNEDGSVNDEWTANYIDSATNKPKLEVTYTLGEASGTSCGYVNSNLDLTADIQHDYGDCLIINASNIYVDCHGYNIISSGLSIEGGSESYVNISNCRIESTGSTGNVAVNIDSTSNDYWIVLNNSIESLESSLEIRGSYVEIINNTINQKSLSVPQAIEIEVLSSFNVTIKGNNITSHGGCLGVRGNNHTFLDNKLKSNSDAIILKWEVGTDGYNLFSNNVINTTGWGDYGVLRDYDHFESSNNIFIDNTFNIPNSKAFSFDDSGSDSDVINSTNSSLNTVDFAGDANNSYLNVHWYADVYVNDSSGTAISGASVNITDKNSNNVFSGTTNSTGWITRQTIWEYQENSTGATMYSNHTFNATASGYLTSSKSENISSNFVSDDDTFIFLTLSADDTPPTISLESPLDAIWVNTSQTYNISATDDKGLANITHFIWNTTSPFTLINQSTQSVSGTSDWKTFSFTFTTGGNYTWGGQSSDNATTTQSTSATNRTLIYDSTYPLISYGSQTKTDNYNSSVNWIYVNVSITETYFSNITYSRNGSDTTYTSIDYDINWTSLADGTYEYNVSMFDKTGNFNKTSSRTLTIDTTYPLISYNSQTLSDNTNYSQNWIYANISLTESNFKNITYSLFYINGTSVNQTNYTSIDYDINWTNLGEYSYSFNVTTYDIADNKNSTATRDVELDTTTPTIDFISPTPANNTNQTTSRQVIINISHTEPNLNYAVLNWNNTDYIQVANNTFTTFTLNNQLNGIYKYNVTVNDSAGNTNTTAVTRWLNISLTSPTVTLLNPSDNTKTNTTSQTFECRGRIDTEAQLDNSTFYWNYSGAWTDSGINNLSSGITDTTQNYTKTLSIDGDYIWNCLYYGNGSTGSAFSTVNYSILIDTIYPTISYNSNTPADATIQSFNWIITNFTSSDTNIDSVVLNWQSAEEPLTKSGDYYSKNKTSLAEGHYLFYGQVNDTTGQYSATSLRNITIDAEPPSVSISSPSDGSTVSQGSYDITMTYSISDASGTDYCYYNVTRGGTTEITNTEISCSSTSETFSVNLDTTTYIIHMAANSSGGNEGYDTSSFYFEYSSSSSPSGSSSDVEETIENISILSYIIGDGICDRREGETEENSADCSASLFDRLFTNCVIWYGDKSRREEVKLGGGCIFSAFILIFLLVMIFLALIIFIASTSKKKKYSMKKIIVNIQKSFKRRKRKK